MLVEERRNRLLELIRLRGFASLPDLASDLEVSESTIRRDLDQLEDNGSARRTHGGVYYTGPSPKFKHFDQIQSRNWTKKKEIAHEAANLIAEGDTVLLDGGSTTYELAQQLVARSLQIVTNSLPVANLFTASDSSDLVMIGGQVHTRTGVSIGPYANHMLAGLNCRRAFLSVAGVHEEGFFNSNLLLVETERAMMRAADEVWIIADSTKFGHKSLSRLCELDEIDGVVVDHGITEDWRSKLLAAGIRLHVAQPLNDTRPDLAG